jgi:spore coat protein A, manganese oxidase
MYQMRVGRRDVLRGLVGAAASFSRELLGQSDETAPNLLTGFSLEPFVDPLPVPSVLKPVARSDHLEHYEVKISQFQQKLHRDLLPTIVWGFEGSMPGPTIVAKRGCPVEILWINKLPPRHRLAVDYNLSGAGKDVPEVRTVIHLHGGHISAKNDGYPDDWVPPGDRQRTFYPNTQPGATLWYHDHSMGITRLNAMMGLAGFYLLHDPDEQRLGLPSGACDIPLILQDRTLDARGQIVYPVGATRDAPWVPEFFGTHILVNGRVWPYLSVQPRPYRFRLLNASNARIYQLALLPRQVFVQIGTDGGLLDKPEAEDELLLAPGERADIIVDFRGHEGHHITLANYASAPYPSGHTPVPRLVMQFQVHHPLHSLPVIEEASPKLAQVPRLREDQASKTRRHSLQEIMGPAGVLKGTLLNGLRFDDPVTEDPRKGTVEIWEFVNTTMDTHPIHLHAVHFQLLDRCPFDVRHYLRSSELLLTEKPTPASPAEAGWKDTIVCPPGQVTRIIVPFNGDPGRFVWHCHMLEHEDNEMMRPYVLHA